MSDHEGQQTSLDEIADEFPDESENETVDAGKLQEIEESPIEGWDLRRLGEVFSLEYGENLTEDKRDGGQYPVYGSNGQVGSHSEAYVDRPGIIVGRKGSIGEAELSEGPFYPIDTTYYISEKETDENLRFVYYLLENIQLSRLNAASAIPGLNRNDAYSLKGLIPPLQEQRKIASILYNIDKAIQKAKEIIDQTKRVESGLFQDLFSGSHLNCETKKVSSLGEIPEHWDVQPMGKICDITMGTSPKSEYYNKNGDGLPFFQANNEFGKRSPTHDRWCSNPVKTATENDILMTIRGTYVGQVNIADRECCIGRGLAGISNGDRHTSEFLYHHLRERERYVKSIAIGSTFDSVSSDELENLDIVVPPLEEQKDISDTLYKVQKQVIETRNYQEQIQRIKQGIMSDLLSGKIRTGERDINVLPEVEKHG